MRIEKMLQVRDSVASGSPNSLAGTWTNELGSTMELQCVDDGTLRGSYTSGVRDEHTYELIGLANATTVVFTVNFALSASIGAWAGHVDHEHGRLDMLWHLVAEPKDDEVWDTTFAGFDTFTKVAERTSGRRRGPDGQRGVAGSRMQSGRRADGAGDQAGDQGDSRRAGRGSGRAGR